MEEGLGKSHRRGGGGRGKRPLEASQGLNPTPNRDEAWEGAAGGRKRGRDAAANPNPDPNRCGGVTPPAYGGVMPKRRSGVGLAAGAAGARQVSLGFRVWGLGLGLGLELGLGLGLELGLGLG
jgi:hypothetical protein